MEYIKDPDFRLENTAVALGKFEGLHRGHQLLFDEIKKQKTEGLKSVVFTFDMPPRSALSGDKSYQQIYTKDCGRQRLPVWKETFRRCQPLKRAGASIWL